MLHTKGKGTCYPSLRGLQITNHREAQTEKPNHSIHSGLCKGQAGVEFWIGKLSSSLLNEIESNTHHFHFSLALSDYRFIFLFGYYCLNNVHYLFMWEHETCFRFLTRKLKYGDWAMIMLWNKNMSLHYLPWLWIDFLLDSMIPLCWKMRRCTVNFWDN
jgi:hypothetical protein